MRKQEASNTSKKRGTKAAIAASFAALLLCGATLVGTTFAWFTDTATTGSNTIQAGHLDIELAQWNPETNQYAPITDNATIFTDGGNVNTPDVPEYRWDPDKAQYVLIDDNTTVSVDGDNTNIPNAPTYRWDSDRLHYILIDDDTTTSTQGGSTANNTSATLWEPGATHMAYLKIANTGNLTLKYEVNLDATWTPSNDGQENDEIVRVMQYLIANPRIGSDNENTNPVINERILDWTNATSLASLVTNATEGTTAGTQTNTMPVSLKEDNSYTYIKPGEAHYFALAINMKGAEADNKFQGERVDFNLTVNAGQYTDEADSFDNQYDAQAPYVEEDTTNTPTPTI